MNIRVTALAAVALGLAAPVMAQDDLENAAGSLGNAAEDIGNAAESTGDAIATGATGAVNAVDDAVDIDVDTDPLASPDLNVTSIDNGMMPMDDMNMVATTTTTTTDESDGGGRWGLLGLLGLLAFLFRPKKSAIHLDERTGRV